MKLKTMTINSSSHSYLRPSLSSSSPRSFLVKKYLKQKYDADFKLQQSLKAEQDAALVSVPSRASDDCVSRKVDNGDNKYRQSQYPEENLPSSTDSQIEESQATQPPRYSEHDTDYNITNYSSGDGLANTSIRSANGYRNDSFDSQSDSDISRPSSYSPSILSTAAAAPLTPKFPQPVAVMLSNGYIIDVTALQRPLQSKLEDRDKEEMLLQGRAEPADHVAARTPGQAHDSASFENFHLFDQQQPQQLTRRSSVIVSNNNHPANRRFPLEGDHVHFRHHPYAVSSRCNMENSTNRYVTSPNHSPLPSNRVLIEDNDFSSHHQHPHVFSKPSSQHIPERRPSSSSTPTPPPAHMPSPPPAHTPITNLLPRHFSPAPAHCSSPASLRVASMPSPGHKSQTPPPAHSSSHVVPANFLLDPRPSSPAYQYNLTSTSDNAPAVDVLPADHPIHHPLVQQLINQRLHVPDKSAPDTNIHDSSFTTTTTFHDTCQLPEQKPNTRADQYDRTEEEITPISPPHQDTDVLYNYDNHFNYESGRRDNNINLNSSRHSEVARFVNIRHSLTQREIKMFSPEEESRTASDPEEAPTQSYSINFSLNNHMPPSPSPSLPSASPSHPSSVPSIFQPSPPVGSPALPLERDQTSASEGDASSPNANSTTYTYEAFLVSDGRSRKRSQSSMSAEGSIKSEANPNTVNGRARYTCGECGKDYATSSNLSRHKQTHRSLDSKSAKKCPHCDKVYVSMPALSMHILTHDLKHPCKICGKNFSRPWLLQGHMRSHTGEKPFGCAHCGKAFADRSNLRAHMQTHSAFKHFSCDKCHKTFALKSYLNKHLESACVKDQD